MNKKKKIFTFIGIIIIICAGYVLYLVKKPHQSIANSKPDYQLESMALISDFEKDENTANTKYLGKVVEVSGVVSEKLTDEKGKLNITLSGEDIAGIGCVFENAAQEAAAQIQEGQSVRIKGICTGILMDVVLVDCVVVN